jgi:hypothetical protein
VRPTLFGEGAIRKLLRPRQFGDASQEANREGIG